MARRRARSCPTSQSESVPAPRGWFSVWFQPDLSLTAALAAVAYCLLVFYAPVMMFGDSDPGWHIVAGEQILRTGHVPRADTFSFLDTGHGWFAWEWLSEAVMALAHRWLGLSGVVFLFTATIGLVFWMCFRLHTSLGGDFFLACLLALPLVVSAQVHWLARPHVIGYVFLLALVFYCERARGTGESPAGTGESPAGTGESTSGTGERPAGRFHPRDALAMCLGTALWASIHGSFIMAAVFPALYAAGHAARALLWKDLDTAREWQRARWFVFAALAAATGSLLNPYGLDLHRHLFAYATTHEITARVSEWNPVNFSAPSSRLILVTAAAGIAGALLALWRRNVPHFLVAACVTVLGLRAARGVPLAALVALPMANAAFTALLRTWRSRSSLSVWFTDLSDEMRELDRGHHGAALVPLAALAMLAWLLQPAVARNTGFSPEWFPVEADAAVAALPASSRIFASFTTGGYFVYRFRGRRKVWLDGRGDYFGAAALDQLDRIASTRAGWQATMAQIGFTHAVIEKRWRIAPELRKEGWRTVFEGRRWLVLENPNPSATSHP